MLARGSPSIRVISALLGCSLLPFAFGATEPRAAVWSDQAYGADGPWNAVEVSLRGQPKVALFPGSMWYTWVTTGDYCALNASFPHCQSGTYDQSDAFREFDTPGGQLLWRPPLQGLAPSIKALGRVQVVADLVHLRPDMFLIENQTLALIERNYHMFEYPDSTQYPVFTGCLNVGAPERHQTFTTGGDGPNRNMTTIPWGMRDDGRTASSSFGLHYGSAGPTAKIPGSLLYGGYDRNRVVGKVLSLEGDLSTPVNLLDISIRVIAGHSPFESLPGGTTDNPDPDKQPIATGLLAQGNSSLSTAGLPVLLDPCNPYLSLPKSTCDAIASYLPVTYNPAIGLYLWNTSSPRYTRIVASASTLSFTITSQTTTTTEPLTIHIPFRHLNLTLSPPFSGTSGGDIPYFPCSAYDDGAAGTGVYSLGRAFFQDAFVGANWEKGAVWLAQAPGPNVPGEADVVDVLPDDAVIAAGGGDWARSWEGVWSVLSAEEADGTVSVDGADGGAGGDGGGGGASEGGGLGEGGGGLSIGAMAGIGVGAALGGMAVIGVAVLFWCRRQRKTAVLPPPSPEGLEITTAPPPWNGYGQAGAPAEVDGAAWRVHEMHGEAWKVHEMHGEAWEVHEMPVPVPEMPGDRPHHHAQ